MGGIAPFPVVSYASDKSEDTGFLSVNGKQNRSLLNVCNMRGLNLKPNQSVKQVPQGWTVRGRTGKIWQYTCVELELRIDV